MKKFFVKDIPASYTVSKWLKENTDWIQQMKSVKPVSDLPPLLCFTIDDFNSNQILTSITEAMEIYGEHGWKSANGESKGYTGFSLVYNPNQIDKLDPHSSTLGTPKNSIDKFFWNSTENHSILKNSYFDGYGFNIPTPASQYKALGEFMQRCLRTRVRSRLSIINGDRQIPGSIDKNVGWHKDEPVYENLRINIPILTNENYLFELENKSAVHLPVGHAYSWNTFVPHRVFSNCYNDSKRVHLVLGFSPWWDYIPEEDAWVQNQYYGSKHPFDMLIDGDVFAGLQLDRNFKIY